MNHKSWLFERINGSDSLTSPWMRQAKRDGGRMNDFLKEAVSLSLLGKCVAAVVGILFIHAAFRVLERTLPRRFGRADARYRVRKFVVFCGYLPILPIRFACLNR